MQPGEYKLYEQSIELNSGRRTISVEVANTGDRPIQVGSHYHFAEVNRALQFDRSRSYCFRLNIPAGTAIRFEPGSNRTVELVEYAGNKVIHGFRGLGENPAFPDDLDKMQPGDVV